MRSGGQIVVTGPPPAEPAVRVDRQLGEAIRLTGFSSRPTTADGTIAVRPGEKIALDLAWAAVTDPAADYTVFLQLVDADGRLAGQYDGQPQSGRYPTSVWIAGDRVGDSVSLTAPAPGTYRLITGLYEVTTGRRLPVDGADFIDLARVTVRP